MDTYSKEDRERDFRLSQTQRLIEENAAGIRETRYYEPDDPRLSPAQHRFWQWRQAMIHTGAMMTEERARQIMKMEDDAVSLGEPLTDPAKWPSSRWLNKVGSIW